jgi:hypothetical protein
LKGLFAEVKKGIENANGADETLSTLEVKYENEVQILKEKWYSLFSSSVYRLPLHYVSIYLIEHRKNPPLVSLQS